LLVVVDLWNVVGFDELELALHSDQHRLILLALSRHGEAVVLVLSLQSSGQQRWVRR
jgi:hypothetical protein